MKRAMEVAIRGGTRRSSTALIQSLRRSYITSQPRSATALPITATGPPPSPPEPSTAGPAERLARKRKQAELIQKGKDIRAAEKPSALRTRDSPLKKRFWTDVFVSEVPEGYHVSLDKRPVRTPTKEILTIPRSKPHLAHAIAIEWDLLVSAQQALKNHNIPMTSITARAQDLISEEHKGDGKSRGDIVTTMMRYLDTDTLLCWAPEKSPFEGNAVSGLEMQKDEQRTGESLRSIQMRVAREIIGYLNTSIWPGVELKPVLDEDSIMPIQQSEVTRSIIAGWISGLPAYELAALERATLASKSLLIAARLLVEWSEEFRSHQTESKAERFGIEEAAFASTIEVRWQTGMWGEVEDSHDVANEDIRRQLGSAILLISGVR